MPPSRAREVQRAFRLRRAEHLATLEERILTLETENAQLRMLLALPEADRGAIGSGPTGRGKSLREGGVPMSERVRARKEARARERRAKGLDPVDADSSGAEGKDGAVGGGSSTSRDRQTSTLSPGASGYMPGLPLPHTHAGQSSSATSDHSMPLFKAPGENGGGSSGYTPFPLALPFSPDSFPDFAENTLFKNNPDNTLTNMYKPTPPNFAGLFSMFDDGTPSGSMNGGGAGGAGPNTENTRSRSVDAVRTALSPGIPPNSSSLSLASLQGIHSLTSPPSGHATPPVPTAPPLSSHRSASSSSLAHSPNNSISHSTQQQHQQHQHQQQQPPAAPSGPPPSQPELLTRLKVCCHLSDSHVVNDPGLLIFATRLCQSFPCSFSGVHPALGADNPAILSDHEHMILEDSWRAMRSVLEPAGANVDADGENRINTGKMAAELVIRAAQSRGGPAQQQQQQQGPWINCRYGEGMSIKTTLIRGLVQGMGGNFD